LRSPGVRGHSVDFGVRVSRIGALDGNGDVCLWQYRSDGSSNGAVCTPFTTSSAWPDPAGQFVTASTLIKSDTQSIRYQVFTWTYGVWYMFDDAYVTRSN
jgi:hypothetical protein